MFLMQDYYLSDHFPGRLMFPATGHITIVWKALCKQNGLDFEQTAVKFTDLSIHTASFYEPHEKGYISECMIIENSRLSGKKKG